MIVGRVIAVIAAAIHMAAATTIISGIAASCTAAAAVIHPNLLLQPKLLTQGLLFDAIGPPGRFVEPEIEVVS